MHWFGRRQQGRPSFATGLKIAASCGYCILKAAAAVWSSFLAHELHRQPSCLVAPRLGSVGFLQGMLAVLAACFALQACVVPCAVLDSRPGANCCQLFGVAVVVLPTFFLVALVVFEFRTMYGSQNSSRAAACEDAISLYSFGVFELSMLVANFEATSFLVFGTLAFGVGLGASMLGAWLLPIFVYVERRRRQQEKKLCDAAVSALEQFCYTAGAGGEACCICLESFAEGDSCKRLPCNRGHIFHSDCLNYWLSRSKLCPLCRKNFVQMAQQQQQQQQGLQELAPLGTPRTPGAPLTPLTPQTARAPRTPQMPRALFAVAPTVAAALGTVLVAGPVAPRPRPVRGGRPPQPPCDIEAPPTPFDGEYEDAELAASGILRLGADIIYRL
mmetsp:Transcript_164126/g.521906  ORF Transcript_164126/g.521906 Transcript_164126/m.521906 type:complete len:387 (-) Transcript_164126:56-1216(-)